MKTRKRLFKSWYCSQCHHVHPYEKVGDMWISRKDTCSSHFPSVTRQEILLAYSVEMRLNFKEYAT